MQVYVIFLKFIASTKHRRFFLSQATLSGGFQHGRVVSETQGNGHVLSNVQVSKSPPLIYLLNQDLQEILQCVRFIMFSRCLCRANRFGYRYCRIHSKYLSPKSSLFSMHEETLEHIDARTHICLWVQDKSNVELRSIATFKLFSEQNNVSDLRNLLQLFY